MYSSKSKLLRKKCHLHCFFMFTDSDPEREIRIQTSWKLGSSQQPRQSTIQSQNRFHASLASCTHAPFNIVIVWIISFNILWTLKNIYIWWHWFSRFFQKNIPLSIFINNFINSHFIITLDWVYFLCLIHVREHNTSILYKKKKLLKIIFLRG